jgi:hypothetical protein
LNKRKSVRGDMDKLSNEIEKYLSKYWSSIPYIFI